MPKTSHPPRYRLIGSNGSPYSMKLRALMRYRRLPHDWVLRTTRNREETADVRPPVIPVLQYPEDGSYHVDTTPIAYALEARHSEGRSVIPDDPCHAYLCHLIEDMADEWLTKAMFYYRWAYPADIEYASLWIADDFFPDAKGDERLSTALEFSERQIGRMELVGCTAANSLMIERSYKEILDLLEAHVGLHDHLFGSRPSLADFALFGQLKTLGTDPTPMMIMRDRAQRVEDWVRQLDDASGLEGDWYASDDDLPKATFGLLAMAGKIYLPFLEANAKSAARGGRTFELEIYGQPYRQGTFKYQLKCLTDLKQRFAALSGKAAERANDILYATDCLKYLTSK